ncbi:MAG: hypothetical protein HQK49_16350 [Oligoflexia bacterium]|nr:hypothetical protein [Oligoflexia bacterium]
MKDFTSTYNSLNKFISLIDIKDFRCLFNPFFWPIEKYMGTTEGSLVFNPEQNKKNYIFTLKILLRHVKNNIFLLWQNMLKKKWERTVVHGFIREDTDYIVYTWLKKEEITAFIREKQSPYIGDLIPKLEIQKKVQPLIHITNPSKLEKKDVALLTDNNCIVIGINSFLPLNSFFIAFKISIPIAFNIFLKFKNYYWTHLFFISIFNHKFILSLAIFDHLKKMIGHCNLKLILTWEGQPEQRAVCAAFRDNGMLTYGYIQSSLITNPCFVSKINSSVLQKAFPNQLFHHGSDYYESLIKVGWDRQDIIYIKSLRYKQKEKSYFEGCLYLPYSVKSYKHALYILSEEQINFEIKIARIKMHPDHSQKLEIQSMSKNIKLDYTSKNIFVVGFSTVIFEALEAGCEHVYQIILDSSNYIDPTLYPSLIQQNINNKVIQYSLKNSCKGSLISFDNTNTIYGFI